ncbi:hypothetical protein CWO90_35940 [Bradyrhizobium sp. Leo121]|nr:hypothetical protein CWO90_35940 [Bradyrhizobium sp. Leo121]
MIHPMPEGTAMQSTACLEWIQRWRKQGSLVAFVGCCSICLISASATCAAQAPLKPADQPNGTSSEDPAATAVFIVDAKKCEKKASDTWSDPEVWAWQQICRHLNVDFDEKEANDYADKREGKDSPKRDAVYRQKLEALRTENNKNPEKLATDESRTLSSKFLAMIFGDPELRHHTWNVPLRLFGFSTDRLAIDTAALKSLDIQNAYVERFVIQNTTLDGDLRLENSHLASIKMQLVAAKHFLLNKVSVTAKKVGADHVDPDPQSLEAEKPDGALTIHTARIEDRVSILEGSYDAIDLKRVKVGDLFILHPDWNRFRDLDKPELSITESVDHGVFAFQANPKGASPRQIKLDQFIFANAYFGPDPMPVVRAMDAYAGIRTHGRPDLEPYTLIAKSYAQRGETHNSDKILIAKNNQDWHWADIASVDFLGLTFTWLVADYGFHPEVGFLWIAGFVLLGWGIFWHASTRLAAGSYQPKSPFLLALDSVIPGIHLDKNHQDVRYNGWPQGMLYLLRILGAVLVFVAFSYLQKKVLG